MKKPYIFPLLLGSLVLTGCANGQIDAMQMRLNQQEQQIRLLNSQLSGVQPAQADTWAQVQSLRQEMSAVKGQIDDFNNATAAAGGLPGLAQRVNNHEAALQAIATQFGIDPVHFGVIATVNLAIGQVTPPVGVNLFVAIGVADKLQGLKDKTKVTIASMSKAVWPMILACVITLLVVTYVPFFSTVFLKG